MVLPAAVRPTTDTTWPGATAKFTAFTAVNPPNRLVSPAMSRMTDVKENQASV